MSLVDRVVLLGRAGLDTLAALGRSGLFLVNVLFGRARFGNGWALLVKQLHAVGVLSLAIIVVSGLFIGMVLALQGYNILVGYGSEQAVGQMVALTLLRELGPVVTALLFVVVATIEAAQMRRRSEILLSPVLQELRVLDRELNHPPSTH